MSSDSITLQIEGIEGVCDKLQALDDKLKGEIVDNALEAGAEPILSTARNLCPFATGATQQAIQVHKGHKKDGYASVVIGPSKQWYTGDQFYAAFVEFGHFQGKR